MLALGAKNSRMRDFFDVHALATHQSFDGEVLTHSLRATFDRRRTEIPAESPIALTPAFADVEGKRAQWSGFMRRIRSSAAAEDLENVIDVIAAFVGPALAAAAGGGRFPFLWRPGGPWISLAEEEPRA